MIEMIIIKTYFNSFVYLYVFIVKDQVNEFENVISWPLVTEGS